MMLLLNLALAALLPRPPTEEFARVARWLVTSTDWGTIATITNGHDSGAPVGTPFANPMSFSDGIANSNDLAEQSTGVPYFVMTLLDETPQDIIKHPMGSFAISENQIHGSRICNKTDTEDPTCSRISLAGRFVDLSASDDTRREEAFGFQAVCSKHPETCNWAPGSGDHDFHVYRLNITSIFFLDFYGGSTPMSPQKYLAAKP